MATFPKVIGGRYGLSSKEFTPAMVKRIYEELTKSSPQNHFTIGINDDVCHTSLDYDANFSTEPVETVRAMFYGLGSDGTVGANKNTIKIIGEETELNVQGYFVYDSKKSGAVTTSHLRFSKKPIRSTYLISRANFVACHQFGFMERLDVLKAADTGAVFLLNTPFGPDEVWDNLPRAVQDVIIKKKLKFYVIDAVEVARAAGMGGRINTVMQTCFFAISGVLPRDEAIGAIKHAIEKTYGKRGESVVRKNFAAVDSSLENLHEVTVPQSVTSKFDVRPPFPQTLPTSYAMSRRSLSAATATSSPSAPCRSTARSRRELRSGRSATSHWKFQCGMRGCAFSVVSVSWSARTRSYEPRYTTRQR